MVRSKSQVMKNHKSKKIYFRSQNLRNYCEKGANVLNQIKKYQSSTQLLIPKASFIRLVREIAQKLSLKTHFWEANAFDALQEAAESFLVNLFETSNFAAIHAKRITLFIDDLHLIRRIRYQ